jgi:CSLREA domain-containing protein
LAAVIQGEKVHRVRVHLTVLAVFAVALTAFAAAPALAAAETFTVNSTDDSPLGSEPEGRCETEVPGVCTLRAAVEAANLTTQADQIGFAETPFDGTSTAIALGSELPAIIHPVSIDGRVCPGYAVGIEGPCVEVTLPEPSTKTPFTVKADSTTIKDLSVVGGAGEIDVEGADGFTATGDWLGITRAGRVPTERRSAAPIRPSAT